MQGLKSLKHWLLQKLSMILKKPITFTKLKQKSRNGLLYVFAAETLYKPAGTKKLESRSFHQNSWKNELETTWISLIGWPIRTSFLYYESGKTIFNIGLLQKFLECECLLCIGKSELATLLLALFLLLGLFVVMNNIDNNDVMVW